MGIAIGAGIGIIFAVLLGVFISRRARTSKGSSAENKMMTFNTGFEKFDDTRPEAGPDPFRV